MKKFDFFLFIANISSCLRHRKIEREIKEARKAASRRAFMRRTKIKKFEDDRMFHKCEWCGEYYYVHSTSDIRKHIGKEPRCTPLSEVVAIRKLIKKRKEETNV